MANSRPGEPLVNNFKIPNWASKPPHGLHLDVAKDGKLFQKLIMDEKSCYFFGRNKQLCDFPVEHQSCSRVHAVLVWHKFLNRAFLIDLGSVHGTFIGKIRLEAHKPQQVPIDSEIHFGASTRTYIIRERPTTLYNGQLGSTEAGLASNMDGSNPMGPENRPGTNGPEDGTTNALGLLYSQLPQSEVELDNLTEFNTAHNRRITSIVDVASNPPMRAGKRRINNVHFSDADEVINPEDVDPSIGRFRNLVQETFIPNKRSKDSHDGAFLGVAAPDESDKNETAGRSRLTSNSTSQNIPASRLMPAGTLFGPTYTLATKLGLPVPNLAPDIESNAQEPTLPPTLAILHAHAHSRPGSLTASLPDGKQNATRLSAADILGTSDTTVISSTTTNDAEAATAGGVDSGLVGSEFPKRKKYAKEAWPGKRPGFLIGPSV